MPSSSSPLYAAIDQGTTSSRFIVFDSKLQKVICVHQVEHTQITPHPGWLSHNPEEIFSNIILCMNKVCDKLGAENVQRIKSIGITNQRETTVAWSRSTGKPLCNAIVWSDARTQQTLEQYPEFKEKSEFTAKRAGLPVSTYFSAIKMRWMLDNEEAVRNAAQKKDLCFGTMDSWLIYKLNGGLENNIHVTDVTNASRTLLMNIETRQWDAELSSIFKIPVNALPTKILPCAHATGFGKVSPSCVNNSSSSLLQNCPITGCVGDQQGALVGQLCFKKGEMKNTYGTGCFLLANAGTKPVFSTVGLLTTVGYQLGENQPCFYALEGAVAGAGSGIQWLRDKMKILTSAKESEKVANSVPNSGGVAFVPAFGGLLSPHWEPSARATIVGMTQQTTSAHIVRAKLEAIAHQVSDLVDCIEQDITGGVNGGGQGATNNVNNSNKSTNNNNNNKQHRFVSSLKVDGGMSANNLLMQLQSDYLGIDVMRPQMLETTAKGAALCGAVGCGSLSVEEVSSSNESGDNAEVFTKISPKMGDAERDKDKKKWSRAIQTAIYYAKI